MAGGLAVNAYGYLRFTKHADLVADLTPPNILALFSALAGLGYRPRVPITAAQFADTAVRATLVREKGMQVLPFYSESHRETPVDIFASEPFPFAAEAARALVKDLPGAGPVPFVSIPTLIRMKELAGREQDRVDVEQLRLRLVGDDQAP